MRPRPLVLPALAVVTCIALEACTMGRDAARPMVRTRASHDLACPDKQIRVRSQIGGRWTATGCGKSATYDSACDGLSCQVWREGEEAPGWRDRPDPGSPNDLR